MDISYSMLKTKICYSLLGRSYYYIYKEFNAKINKLSDVHKFIKIEELNDIRLGFYNEVNKSQDFSEKFLELGFQVITNVVGTELAMTNKNVNFSMQLPYDDTSKLPIHMDTFSGESPYQINLWIPLTDAHDTNSMFIFNRDFSGKVYKNLSNYERDGLESLLETNKNAYCFLEVPFGRGVVFTPTCLHGNVTNRTEYTRMSFNCRYKNLFSPYNQKNGNEKKLGSFYKAISPKATTIIGVDNKI